MPRRQSGRTEGERVPTGLRINEHILKALKMYALMNDRYAYEVLEAAILVWFERNGIDVEDIIAQQTRV